MGHGFTGSGLLTDPSEVEPRPCIRIDRFAHEIDLHLGKPRKGTKVRLILAATAVGARKTGEVLDVEPLPVPGPITTIVDEHPVREELVGIIHGEVIDRRRLR
jgi:hypothetical protein